MVIGFSQRNQTVSESEDPIFEIFQFSIGLATLRTAEREHAMTIRVQKSISTAIVEPLSSPTDPNFDAIFGNRDAPGQPIRQAVVLAPGTSTIPLLPAAIRNDFTPEDEECFTIRVFPDDVPGHRELFMCNEDSSSADNFFCEHTLCITDDDGEFYHIHQIFCIGFRCSPPMNFQGHLRLHLWRQPTLLMRMWVQ